MAPAAPTEFGGYRLLKKLAQGGMAEIFLVQGPKGEVRALKRILPHLAHEEGFIRMFLDEARIVSHLSHDNVANVFDHGKHDGYYYMVMEYVEGHSLLSVSEKASSMKIPLPRGLLAFLVAELLNGLAHAHNARDNKGRHLAIVHRDVTPQNVMIGYDGLVKLIDFGVAKARARLTKTEAGFTKGKLAYMSPEQARGEELDGRSDLFSVGIILYEITTGTRLFNKDGPGGILSAIVNDPIPPPSKRRKDYPEALEEIVMKALAKEVRARWQTAEDMRDALLRFAKKEKPTPSRARMAALVSDLFGAPEHRHLIEGAPPVGEVTPDQPVPVALPEDSAIRIRGDKIDLETGQKIEATPPEPKPDETRMFQPGASVSKAAAALPGTGQSKIHRDITGDAIAALPQVELDVPVPEPKVSLRLRFARWLAGLAGDVRMSWRLHKKRYLAALGGAAAIGVVLLLVSLGVPGAIGRFAASTAEKARELKKAAGLEPGVIDSGVRPTFLALGSEPPGASITIDGLGAGCVTPCDVEDVELGKRLKLDFELPGYRPKTERVTLWPNEGKKELLVTLERQVGGLVIDSDPPGAEVSVDGTRLRSPTPATLDGLVAGKTVAIEVRKAGFLPERRSIKVDDGEQRTERFTLRVNPGTLPPAEIWIESDPAGCPATLDGQGVGVTPVRGVTVREGDHKVTVKCPHYAEEVRTFSARPGQRVKVDLRLSANEFGYLTVRVTPSAGTEVKINGRAVKLPIEFLKVVPGRHRLEIANAGAAKSRSLVVDVAAEQRVLREVNLFQ